MDLEAAKIIPENIAKRYNVIPFSKIGNALYLAMSDPLDRLAIQDIRYMTNLDVKPVLVSDSDVKVLIDSVFKSGDIKDAANEYLSNLDA
jgi:type IV pilus assembly protein PilB